MDVLVLLSCLVILLQLL